MNLSRGHRIVLLAAGLFVAAVPSADSRGVAVSGSTPAVVSECVTSSTRIADWLRHFYLRAATGSHQALWHHYRGDMQLAAPIDSADISLETDPTRCAVAAALYRATLPGEFDDGAAVVRYGPLRAIVMRRHQPNPRIIEIGPSIQLITDSSFTTVIDTLWW